MENLILKPDPLREVLDLLGQYAQVRTMLKDLGVANAKSLNKAVETLEVEICNRINAIKEPVA